MSDFDDDTLVGSLLEDDDETYARRSGRVIQPRAVDPADRHDSPFNREFDRHFRVPRSRVSAAQRQELHALSKSGMDATEMAAERYRIMQTVPARARRRIVLDAAEPDAIEEVDEFDEDIEQVASDVAPRRSREELREHLARLDASLAALASVQVATPQAAALPSQMLQCGSSGDSFADLGELAVALGIPTSLPIASRHEDFTEGDDMDQEYDEDHEYVDEAAVEATGKGRAYIPAAKTDDHCSPLCIARALFRTWQDTDLDPCASRSQWSYIEAGDQWYGPRENDIDGLSRSWFGKVYFNPPYGREIKDWIDKAILEMDVGSTEAVIALLPIRSDVPWYHDVLATADAICFIRGRLRFGGAENSAPFPSIAVLWGRRYLAAFTRAFGVDKEPSRLKGKHALGTVLALPRTVG